VIATVGPGGTLHQSVVRYVLDGDDVLISTEATRVKARHIEAGGRVSFCVMATEPPFAAVTLHGTGSVQRTGIAEPTRRIMALMGRDGEVSDESLASRGRVILRISPGKVLTAWL